MVNIDTAIRLVGGTTIIIIGVINMFLLPREVLWSQLTLQDAVHSTTAAVNIVFGVVVVLTEVAGEQK